MSVGFGANKRRMPTAMCTKPSGLFPLMFGLLQELCFSTGRPLKPYENTDLHNPPQPEHHHPVASKPSVPTVYYSILLCIGLVRSLADAAATAAMVLQCAGVFQRASFQPLTPRV